VFILQYQKVQNNYQISWNKRRSKRFQRRHLWRQRSYCYLFY